LFCGKEKDIELIRIYRTLGTLYKLKNRYHKDLVEFAYIFLTIFFTYCM
jgi:hypothetical protein